MIKNHLSVLILFLIFLSIGCEKKYTLEESRQIQFIKNLIVEINKNVDKQKALLELINTEKDESSLARWKYEFNEAIDFYYELKKNIDNEIAVLNTADINYDFDKIEEPFKKIN